VTPLTQSAATLALSPTPRRFTMALSDELAKVATRATEAEKKTAAAA
jgi:hypothetical protein